MKRSTRFTTYVLSLFTIPAIALTYTLTSSLRARPISRAALSQAEALKILRASVGNAKVTKSPLGAASTIPGVPDDFSQYVKIDCIGTFLHVDATTVIPNIQADDGNVWSVRVVDAETRKTILFTRFFDYTPAERKQGPTSRLDEVMELPLDAGDYVVLVDFYRVPRDPGMDAFLDPKTFDVLNISGGSGPIGVER